MIGRWPVCKVYMYKTVNKKKNTKKRGAVFKMRGFRTRHLGYATNSRSYVSEMTGSDEGPTGQDPPTLCSCSSLSHTCQWSHLTLPIVTQRIRKAGFIVFPIHALGTGLDRKWVLLLQHRCLEVMGAVLHCILVDILGRILQGSSLGWVSGRSLHGRGGKESRASHWGKWNCVRVVTETQSHAEMELR